MDIRDRIVELRRVPGRELIANRLNYRTHPAAQRSALAGVLEKVGIAAALIARETPEGLLLIDGHLRAEDYGDQDWPVLVLDVTEAEANLLLAALDPLAEMAEHDNELLAQLLDELTEEEQDLVGFLYEEEKPATFTDPDDVPDAPAEPITKVGDLWVLGSHRLLCGDSTKTADVERLMDGERAGLMNTDPPYGVAYANDDRPNPGVAKPRVAKDDLADEKLQEFLESVFRLAKSDALASNAAWYLWHAHLTQGFFAAAAAADVVLHRQIIWVKPVLLLTRGQYHWKHEPCFMGWVRGQQPPDYGRGEGERDQTTVWEVAGVSVAERKEFNHSTPKPVELFTIPIVKHLAAGEIAYEPFAGSGPQFIAAEMQGRRCFGIEIDPGYCDVIVARWEQFTGQKAQLAS